LKFGTWVAYDKCKRPCPALLVQRRRPPGPLGYAWNATIHGRMVRLQSPSHAPNTSTRLWQLTWLKATITRSILLQSVYVMLQLITQKITVGESIIL